MPVDVWGGGSDMPYLQVVETAGEDTYSQYNSEELIERLKHVETEFDKIYEESLKGIKEFESKKKRLSS